MRAWRHKPKPNVWRRKPQVKAKSLRLTEFYMKDFWCEVHGPFYRLVESASDKEAEKIIFREFYTAHQEPIQITVLPTLR